MFIGIFKIYSKKKFIDACNQILLLYVLKIFQKINEKTFHGGCEVLNS